MEPQRPVSVIRDGNLKASIWQNQNENGPYFTTTIARSYKDEEGKWRDSQSFFRSDLLRVAELGRQAYGRMAELARAQSQQHTPTQASEDAGRDAFKAQRAQGAGQQNGHGQGF